ncbi:bifunctional precorrin-2 dehydrogenase/sirohydrochlorin ferrochelatase [Anaerocolumna sp. AGMB13025]|uniref:precorrin-2 dehydrogenase/sirohydrochlorin ferrochelatase family protein n=1 Tax=Anaerocolumna sp. AGMB13025 TaxID=3039116 RepID=UPI00241ECD7C|nr:bifunctional precorrin-2 dehydrogenase/sirohydrochlorin ferrochelatase [Anaerocolumna sp. AGMB13025]WFR59997.1 bifunctional precorrin-2 dehydrogenase/sirohydrochlorin ferrochelatase [Anaerocolumna sp. AGMB13025]
MAYFPMFMDLKNESCVVIGGGLVAYRKVKALLEFEAKVTVIAAEFCEPLIAEDKISRKRKNYETEDLFGAFLVIAATNDLLVNQRISAECRERKIPVNVVDIKEECSFIFPAFVKKGDITVGVTSSGKSPIISQKLKKKINEVIPDYLAELVEHLGSTREAVLSSFEEEEKRKQVFKQLVELGCLKKGKLTDEDVREIIQNEKERYR